MFWRCLKIVSFFITWSYDEVEEKDEDGVNRAKTIFVAA